MELENIVANTVYLKAKESNSNKDKGKSRKWRELLKFQHITFCEEIRSQLTDENKLNYEYVVNGQPIGELLFHQYCERISHLKSIIEIIKLIKDYQLALPPQRWDLAEKIRNNLNVRIPSREFEASDFNPYDNLPKTFTNSKQKALAILDAAIRNNNGCRPSSTARKDKKFSSSASASTSVSVVSVHAVASPPPAASSSSNNQCAASSSTSSSSQDPHHNHNQEQHHHEQKEEEHQQDEHNEQSDIAELNSITEIGKDLFNDLLVESQRYLSDGPFKNFTETPYFDRYLQWKELESRKVDKHTFRMYRVLGKGGFGEVCACQVRASGKLYACKKLEKKRVKSRHGETMAMTEKDILKMVNSRFVVNLAYAFETKEALCLVLTIMNGGDLKFHIHSMNQDKGFEESRARFYAAEITLGLEHLHQNMIVYRDLKPENILIDDAGHLRISDLGLAISLRDKSGKTKGKVGTPGYMAPEVRSGYSYMFSPDWFGLGCIIYEMVAGEAPFRKRKERITREELEKRIIEKEETYDEEKFSEEARDICTQLLRKNVEDRLGSIGGGDITQVRDAKEVKEHAWFRATPWDRLEAGLEQAPFRPDPHAVYAKDVLDIEQFSTVKGVQLDGNDLEFYANFCSGAISIPWQQEMIETDCFSELNTIFVPVTAEGGPHDEKNPATGQSEASAEMERHRDEQAGEGEIEMQVVRNLNRDAGPSPEPQRRTFLCCSYVKRASSPAERTVPLRAPPPSHSSHPNRHPRHEITKANVCVSVNANANGPSSASPCKKASSSSSGGSGAGKAGSAQKYELRQLQEKDEQLQDGGRKED